MIEIIGLEDEKKWLDIVKQFKDHDVYYLPQYTKAFRIHGDGQPYLFYYQSSGTKAINVVMKRDIAKDERFVDLCSEDTYFDIVTPYGYGGFLVEGEKDNAAMEALEKEYTSLCKALGIVSEFVRFHPELNNQTGLESVYDLTERGGTISMNLCPPEDIISNIKAKTRNRIRKADANGVKVFEGDTWDLYATFKKIYDKTMEGNYAQQYYYFEQDFYKSVMSDLKDNARVFYASYKKEIIAAAIILFCNKKMHMHLTASKREFLYLSPVAYLYFKSALWGCENGYKTLHLGGGVGSREDSLYSFKTNFNKESNNRFVTGSKIFDVEKYDYLLSLRGKDLGEEFGAGFFPRYRA